MPWVTAFRVFGRIRFSPRIMMTSVNCARTWYNRPGTSCSVTKHRWTTVLHILFSLTKPLLNIWQKLSKNLHIPISFVFNLVNKETGNQTKWIKCIDSWQRLKSINVDILRCLWFMIVPRQFLHHSTAQREVLQVLHCTTSHSLSLSMLFILPGIFYVIGIILLEVNSWCISIIVLILQGMWRYG